MPPTIERELNEVERQIARLRIDFERFFSGDLKLMPVPARRRLEAVLRKLWEVETERASDRFRLQTLQERYAALIELSEKRQRLREEGRRLHPRVAGGGAAPPGEPPGARAPGGGDAAGPSPVKGKPRADFRPLFERYQAARRQLGGSESSMTYDRFEELVRQRADEIRQRTGATKLVFEVRTEGGKVRLVGRPAPAKG